MTVEVKIVANNATDLLAKMAEVATAMSSPEAGPVSVDAMLTAINAQLPEGMECVIVDNKAEPETKPEKKKAAPKKEKKEEPEPEPEVEEEPETEEPEDEDTGDTEDGDSPKADFDAALELLSECYGQDDGKAAVMALVKKYDVQRFADIDPSNGPDLLKAARKIAVDCGVA